MRNWGGSSYDNYCWHKGSRGIEKGTCPTPMIDNGKEVLPKGYTRYTIGQKGCALTSVANSLTALNARNDLITPWDLDIWGSNIGYASKTGSIIFDKMVSMLPGTSYKRVDDTEYENKNPIQVLEEVIDSCKIPIVHTHKNAKNQCTHFLMAYDYKKAAGDDRTKDTIYIHDVGHKNYTTLNNYSNEVCDIRTIE